MIASAREALRQAALDGVRQLYYRLADERGGYCAGGVISLRGIVADQSVSWAWADRPVAGCPLCANEIGTEWGLLVHLNNVHRCDFLKISELMPVTEEP